MISFLFLLTPFILLSNLLLLFGTKVILNVKGLANLFGRLSLDHVCNGFACQLEELLNVQVVCGQNHLKEHRLVNLAKVQVPTDNVISSLFILFFITWRRWVLRMVLAVVNDLGQDFASHIGQWNGQVNTGVLNEVGNGFAHLGDLDLYPKVHTVLALKRNLIVVAHFFFRKTLLKL